MCHISIFLYGNSATLPLSIFLKSVSLCLIYSHPLPLPHPCGTDPVRMKYHGISDKSPCTSMPSDAHPVPTDSDEMPFFAKSVSLCLIVSHFETTLS